MKLLFLDPGSNVFGWAVYNDNKLIQSGAEKWKGNFNLRKILDIYNFIYMLINRVNPDRVVSEAYYVSRGKGADIVPKVKGIVELALVQLGYIEYENVASGKSSNPKTYDNISGIKVKSIVGGHGKASKDTVRDKVKEIYGVETDTFDQSDAIAIGHAYITLQLRGEKL